MGAMAGLPRDTAPQGPAGFDVVGHLSQFVSGPAPRVLIVKGAPGSGKSTLLHSLVNRLPGPFLFVAYRSEPSAVGPRSSGSDSSPDVALLLVDPAQWKQAKGENTSQITPVPLSFAPTGHGGSDPFPPALKNALAGLIAAGSGCVIVDSWDRTTEESFKNRAGEAAVTSQLMGSTHAMQAQLGRMAVHTVIALFGDPNPEIDSVADGVVELGSEEVDGARLRRLSIEKLRGASTPDTHFLYSLAGGEFFTPTAHPAGFVGPAGPADAEPSSVAGMTWPGSAAFAEAFGRLRHHGLTAIELDAGSPHQLINVVAVPMSAAVVRAGGRVVWVPPGLEPPARLCTLLARLLPREAVAQSVRILTASGPDPALGDLQKIVLPVHRRLAADEGGTARSADGDPVTPLFPEAHRFLRDVRTDGPTLFVLSLEGLGALSAVSGAVYDPATFPLIAESYARLGRFHGIGFGRAENPLTKALLPSVDTHIRLCQRYGRSILVGVRPRTAGYMLDWAEPDGRYSLVPML
jgi:hypothetical protein